jgi:hypothetical protein
MTGVTLFRLLVPFALRRLPFSKVGLGRESTLAACHPLDQRAISACGHKRTLNYLQKAGDATQ